MSADRQPVRDPSARGGRVARRRERMRAALVDAGIRAFMRRGSSGVSVEDLIAEADVCRATFYECFSSKYNLLEYIINPIYEDLVRAVRALRAGAADAAGPATDATAADTVVGLVEVWIDARRTHGDGLLLMASLDEADLEPFEPCRAALHEAMVEALGPAERAELLRNGSARYSAKLVARTVGPLLDVYDGHPGAEALIRDALGTLLLRTH